MSKCISCQCNLIGTAANPPKSAMCSYCKIKRLRTALLSLTDSPDNLEELEKMKNAIAELEAPSKDRLLAINAIQALIDTK